MKYFTLVSLTFTCFISWAKAAPCEALLGQEKVQVSFVKGAKLLQWGAEKKPILREFTAKLDGKQLVHCTTVEETTQECFDDLSGSADPKNEKNVLYTVLASINYHQESIDYGDGEKAKFIPSADEFKVSDVREGRAWLTQGKLGGLYEFKDQRGRVLGTFVFSRDPSACR